MKIKTTLFIFAISFFFNMISISIAHAYLDPGTGSIILQAIVAFIAGAIAFFSFHWLKLKNKIKNLIQKFKKK